MADQFRFAGPDYRAMLKVYDRAGTRFAYEPTTFCLMVLPQSANKYTAYSLRVASQVYYGTSLPACLGTLFTYVPGFQMPPQLRKYL